PEDGPGPEDRGHELRALETVERVDDPLLDRDPFFDRCRVRKPSGHRNSLKPHAVRVAVLVVPLVRVPTPGGHAGLAHDDHAGGAAVDAEAAAGADVLVDDEDHVVVGIDARLVGVDRVGHRLGRQHVDALPRTDVDTALAHDAL